MANSAAESLSSWVDPEDVMAVTAQSSGRTLGTGELRAAAGGPMSAAAAAALRRNQAALPRPSQGQVAAITSDQNCLTDELDIEGLGHRDRQTEQLVRALRRLGSSDADAEMLDASTADAEPRSSDHDDVAPARPALQGAAEQPGQQDTAVEQASAAAEESAEARQTPLVREPSVGAEISTLSTAADKSREAAGTIAAAARVAEPDASGSEPVIDATTQRFRQAERAVHELKAAAASQEEASTALQALQTILRNALNAPQDDRYRRLRPRNPAFARRLGRFPQALEVLHVAGFHEAVRGSDDPVLALQRTDPGLLWLALEAVQTAMASG